MSGAARSYAFDDFAGYQERGRRDDRHGSRRDSAAGGGEPGESLYDSRSWKGDLPAAAAAAHDRNEKLRNRVAGDTTGLNVQGDGHSELDLSIASLLAHELMAQADAEGVPFDRVAAAKVIGDAAQHWRAQRGGKAKYDAYWWKYVVEPALRSAEEHRREPRTDAREAFKDYINEEPKPNDAEDLDRRAAIFAKQMCPIVEWVERPIAAPVLEGVMVGGGIVTWVGPSRAGKTHLGMSFGLSVAAGHAEWLGRRIFLKGAVAYLCAEGPEHLITRGRAWQKHRGEPLPKDFHVLHGGLRLADKDVRRNAHAYLERLRPVLFVVDTFSAATGGIDENSSGEVGAVLDWVREGVYRSGALAIVVHHSGWSNAGRARGSGVLECNVDGVVTIADQVMKPKKLRRGHGRPLGYGFKSVPLGEDPAYPGVELEDSVVVARSLDPTLEIVAMVELLGDEKGWPLPLKVVGAKYAEQSGVAEDTAERALKDAIPEGEKNADPSTGLYRVRGETSGRPWMIRRATPEEREQ